MIAIVMENILSLPVILELLEFGNHMNVIRYHPSLVQD